MMWELTTINGEKVTVNQNNIVDVFTRKAGGLNYSVVITTVGTWFVKDVWEPYYGFMGAWDGW